MSIASAETTMDRIPKQFITSRQGKDHVSYAGLLDYAHRELGLKAIRTQFIQAPSETNGHMAVMWAEVTCEHGSFTGIGDADPISVGRMIVPHILRMAETRAKARALRDAANIGGAALEELGPDGEERDEPLPTRNERPPTGVVTSATPAPATQAQINRLEKLHAALGQPPAVPSGLNSAEAAERIADLVKRFNAQAKGIATGSAPASAPADPPPPAAFALAHGLLVEISSLVYNLGRTDLAFPEDDPPFSDLVQLIDARIALGIDLVDHDSPAKRGKPKAAGPVASTLNAYRVTGVPLATPPLLSEQSAAWLIGALRTVYDAHVAEQLADRAPS